MSQLSAHLFPFGYVDSPRCSCGVTHETVSHYLLDCPLYAAQRERLLVAIRNIIAPTLHPATLPILDKDASVFHLGFKRGMALPIIGGHLNMNAGHPVDPGGHFQH